MTPFVPAKSQFELPNRTQSINEWPGCNAHLFRGLPVTPWRKTNFRVKKIIMEKTSINEIDAEMVKLLVFGNTFFGSEHDLKTR